MSFPPATRRRRAAAEAEQEILRAAEEVLAERPWHELTVGRVMARTELSRPAFYVYFRDRVELLLRLAERLAGEIDEVAGRWLAGTGSALPSAERTHRELAAVYARHGPALRAIVEAARDEPAVERLYRRYRDRLIGATAARLRSEASAGRVSGLDPEPTATALVLMSERVLLEHFGFGPRADPDEVARTLFNVWCRAVYLRPPEGS